MQVTIRSFREAESDIRFVRDIVFGEEQNVAREVDWDGMDSHCIQIVATDDDSHPIGTGRMQPDGKIGRLAVLDAWRGQGVGQKMLKLLVENAEREGWQEVYLHAQVQATAFYEMCGFYQIGQEFLEADIPHVKMTKKVSKNKGLK